jgi:hypothetical protein
LGDDRAGTFDWRCVYKGEGVRSWAGYKLRYQQRGARSGRPSPQLDYFHFPSPLGEGAQRADEVGTGMRLNKSAGGLIVQLEIASRCAMTGRFKINGAPA